MQLENGIIIPTVIYYGSLIETGEVSIDEVGDFISQTFYSIDSISPASYIGYKKGTLITSGGFEYFTHHDVKTVHFSIQEAKQIERDQILITYYKN